MKRIALILMVFLTVLELEAQTNNLLPVPSRRQRFGMGTNGLPSIPQPYPPGTPVPGAGSFNPNGIPRGRNNLANPGGNPGGFGANTPAGNGPSKAAAAAAKALDQMNQAGGSSEEMIPPGLIDFEGVDMNEVLKIYAKLVNRTLLRGSLPESKIVLTTQTPLTKAEAIQALQAVLALNGVSVVNIGEKFVKVLQSDGANSAGGEFDRSTNSADIPSLGSYVTHVAQLKYVKPSLMQQVLQPFGKLNSFIPLDENGVLVIRDYAENIKRMLEMIAMVDVSVPAEYVSEVIPIRYAKVDDIANALNALGGGGGATVSVGTAQGQISGVGGRSGMSSMGGSGGIGGGGIGGGGIGGGGIGGGGQYQSQQTGGIGGSTMGNRTSPNGTAAGGSTFQQRLNSIINGTGAGGTGGAKDPIQLFGQTKIIPNESSSSLLIYATRADMKVIQGIIDKLDVPLSQVLIEGVIMDVTIGNTFSFGASVAQNPAALSPGGSVLGGGGMVNSSSPFISFMNNVSSVTNGLSTNGLFGSISQISSVTSTAGTNGAFGNALPGGFSYFGNIGPTWDVALSAAESDNHANIIQRPRIQTSQAKAAQFFVGNTVPYVTGTYSGYAGGVGGNSYSQLSVGVELDVTPFINPEGLVVMDIQQEIDDLNGYTAIENVGNVPNTIKRTLSTEIAVRDRDTVMLGGFIKTDKSHTESGVPFLEDIPILGNLFKQRADSKDREELIVLIRPTVLKTPELAAKHTRIEEQRLPGVEQAAADDGAYERTLIEAEKKRAAKELRKSGNYEGFFTPPDEERTNVLERSSAPETDTNGIPSTNGIPVSTGAGSKQTSPATQGGVQTNSPAQLNNGTVK